ncbi:hypothetical protein ACHAXT_008623 [Thalassiosira profunda]
MRHAESVAAAVRRRRRGSLLALLVAAHHPSPDTSTLFVGALRPPRRRAAPAFLPRLEGVELQRRRRVAQRASLGAEIVFGLRGGGIDEEAVADIEVDVAVDVDVPSEQPPVVDVSVVESEDTTMVHVTDDDDGSVEMSDTSRAQSADLAKAGGSEESYSDASEESLAESSDADISDSSSNPTIEVDPELVEKQSQLRTSAGDRRAEGKTLHDVGSLSEAADAFRDAASLLDEALDIPYGEEEADIAVERATCRLHEALCLLKDGRPGECVEACSDVLGDGVTVEPLEEGEFEDGASESADASADVDADTDVDATTDEGETKSTPAVKVITQPASTDVSSSLTIPPPIRARALHRRAKARLALDDLDGAVEDARSAAFLGDRNAVQFYGRLLREGAGAAAEESATSLSPFGSSEGGASNPFLRGMLEGMQGTGNPLMPSGAGSSDFSSSLLSSLLTNGANDGGGGNPLGLMGELLSPPESKGKSRRRRGRKKKGGGGMDGLAKSVLSSLVKRIEDEETQEKLCNYLRSTNAQQIMQFATMAGVPMKEESARRLATLAGGVTPKGISKGVARVKRGISIVKVARKVLKVIDKYKAVIILAVLGYWIRSALLEPYPVSKKKAQKLAQQAALGLAVMPSGSSKSLGNLCGGVARVFGGLFLAAEDGDGASRTGIEEELERLQNQLTLIEALEERNKAQLESFVDEEDQWNSLEEEERELLSSKAEVVREMETLSEELVLLFLGEKMRGG